MTVPFTIPFALLVACAEDGELPPDRADADRMARIDNGDGTYSLAVPEDFDPTALVQESILTWEYVGQARFPNDPQSPRVGQEIVRQPDARTVTDTLLLTQKTDEQGREWRVVAVDEQALEDLIAASDATSPEVRVDDAQDDLHIGADDEGPVGTVTEIEYQFWSYIPCDGNILTTEQHLWNGESRNPVSPPTGVRQSAVVGIAAPDMTCTGTILTDWWVLTAAHCVTNEQTHARFDPNDVGVHRLDKIDPRNASALFVDPDWLAGSGSSNDDVALIKLDSAFDHDFEDMNISAATDGTIRSITRPHNLGLPRWTGGTACDHHDEYATLYHNFSDELGDVGNERLNMHMDGAEGQSGGPVYYCPDGDINVCTGSEKGYVLAVWSGWNPTFLTQRGAKGPAFRSWALSIVNSN